MTVSHCRRFTVAGGRQVPQGLLTDINFQTLSFSAMLNSQQMAEIDTTLPHLQLKFIDSTVTSSSISYHTYGGNLPGSTSLLTDCHQIMSKVDVLLGSFFLINAQILLHSFNESQHAESI